MKEKRKVIKPCVFLEKYKKEKRCLEDLATTYSPVS